MSRRTIDFVRQQKMDLSTLEGLRLIISAGAPLSLELRNELRETFRKCEVIDIVGQTEMTSTIIVHAEPANIARKPTAVGLPAPGMTVALLDESNRPVADGEVGELCYLGENLMLGYWNKPEATAAAMAGGWFHSGDLGRRDKDGILSVVGRKKELIKTGGENVIPNEVEDILRAVPGIADVCVLGLEDAQWGERVHAVLAVGETAADVEDLRAQAEEACRSRLSRFKVPKTWSILEALPANPIGKCDKARLRTMIGDGKGPADMRAGHSGSGGRPTRQTRQQSIRSPK
jgi:acyl-CoA synthetase (AMP-forming)/AMP-acid ligase II